MKRFDMEKCKPIKTPMPTNGHLDLDEEGNPVNQTLYRSMIGSLLYLTASRPDIMRNKTRDREMPHAVSPTYIRYMRGEANEDVYKRQIMHK